MNNVCKEYMAEIKALFPVQGKDEKELIKKMTLDVEAYCEESGGATKEQLYKSYGTPQDVVYNYYSSIETEIIVKRIKVTKYIRALVVALIILGSIITMVFGSYFYAQHLMDERQEIAVYNEKLEEYK